MGRTVRHRNYFAGTARFIQNVEHYEGSTLTFTLN